MKKVTYLIIILIILICALSYKIKFNNNDFNTISLLQDKKLKDCKTELATFEQNFIYERENENLELDGNLPLIDIEGNTVLVKNIIKVNSLVLRFSELNCGECINAEINALVNNKNKIKEITIN